MYYIILLSRWLFDFVLFSFFFLFKSAVRPSRTTRISPYVWFFAVSLSRRGRRRSSFRSRARLFRTACSPSADTISLLRFGYAPRACEKPYCRSWINTINYTIDARTVSTKIGFTGYDRRDSYTCTYAVTSKPVSRKYIYIGTNILWVGSLLLSNDIGL